tara:strand:+ start:288 stop:1214 length:927 start_codon:yes stop_codon:yes gene_type:complete
MRKYFFTLFVLFSFFIVNKEILSIENKIIAKVENSVLTSHELKNKIRVTLVLSDQEINQNNINKIKANVLSSLLNLKIKKLELDKYKVDIRKIDANNHLSSISSNNIIGLKEKFVRNNLDFNLFLTEIKTELAWRQFIFNMYNNKVNIDGEDIDFELSKIIENNSTIEEYKISEIEIFVEEEMTINKQINFILDQIKKIGFENTAEKFSISASSVDKGDLGWINSKSFSKKIFKILKDMQIGDISKPIRNPNSILFLKLIDKKNSKVGELDKDEIKSKLIQQKKNELFNLYSNSHLSKLKNNALIEYK